MLVILLLVDLIFVSLLSDIIYMRTGALTSFATDSTVARTGSLALMNEQVDK
jgi:hypothetical protein